MRTLAGLGTEELRRHRVLCRRLLGDVGTNRPRTLDPLPLALPERSWQTLEQGLCQRADLLSRLLADLYGAQQTLKEGILPAELIYSAPGYLRPCLGLPLAAGPDALPFYAADIGYTTDGMAWVVCDRCQGLGSVGFALEQRLILSRVLPELFRTTRVHRLAGFFGTVRQTLRRLGRQSATGERSVLLAAGTEAPDYPEQAHLARYLGYTLVTGEDLTVRGGRLFLRALEGLQPIDVVLRGIADSACDSLELDPFATEGVAGLIQAVRTRQVVVADPPGSALLEHPALAGYLPRLCRFLLGQDLTLPSPASYWCGEPAQRTRVLSMLERLQVYDLVGGQCHEGRQLTAAGREALREAIADQPERFAAREPLTTAPAPCLGEDGVRLQPAWLRAFLVADEDAYRVMPGGLGWQGRATPAGAVGKDVWVLASQPVAPLTLLSATARAAPGTDVGGPSSRVAEKLFWLGRYAERVEGTVRLLRVVLLEQLEQAATRDPVGALPVLLRALTWLTETFPGFAGSAAENLPEDPGPELASLLLDPDRDGSLAANLEAMHCTARVVRDRLSTDLWRVLEELERLRRRQGRRLDERWRGSGADAAFLDQALRYLDRLLTASAAVTGLVQDSMTHGRGWSFLMLGRRLERGLQLQRLLRPTLTFAHQDMLILEPLLEVCDSRLSYQHRHAGGLRIEGVLELLLDERNPRALGYQLRHLQQDVAGLPGADGRGFQRHRP
ncbi:MAG: circularly permuted type 2 ATP-grasp protein, partial [Candidatus Competibacterales bacterium]|nr:circularly permuted type 2 ATP-grasp protein [Candidatus Competibacterales bacterium]